MKRQALFSSKDKSKKLECRLLQFLFGALRVKRESSFAQLERFHWDSTQVSSCDSSSEAKCQFQPTRYRGIRMHV